jgi:hypothetical protein
MRKIPLMIVLFAAVAFAQSTSFRQKLRHIESHCDHWRRDDGSVVSSCSCLADQEVELIDGGSWPLKHRAAFVDGGLPTPVVNSCAQILEARNGLDGGLQ